MNQYDFSCISRFIQFEKQVSMPSRCAVSPNMEIAIPLRKRQILVVSLTDDFFAEENASFPVFRYLDVEPPTTNDAYSSQPALCGGTLCSRHRNLACEKSDMMLNLMLSDRFYMEESLFFLDLDFSPLVEQNHSYLLVVTVRGDCLIYHFSPKSVRIVADMKTIFHENIDFILDECFLNKDLVVPHAVIIRASWLPMIGENSTQYISTICKMMHNNINTYFYLILSICHGRDPVLSIDKAILMDCEVQPSLLRHANLMFDDVCVSLVSVGGIELQFILFNGNKIYIYKVSEEGNPVDASLIWLSPTQFILVMFYSLSISLSIYGIKTDELSINCLINSNISSKSPSEIVGGFYFDHHIYYSTKSGNIFDYDNNTQTHAFISLKCIKPNETVSHILWNQQTPFFIVLHSTGLSRKFSSETAFIEFVMFGSSFEYINKLIMSTQTCSRLQKLSLPLVLNKKNFPYACEAILDYTKSNLSGLSNITLQSIFIWRLVHLCLIHFLRYYQELSQTQYETIVYYIIYYRCALMRYVYLNTLDTDQKELLGRILGEIFEGNKINMEHSYCRNVLNSIFKFYHISNRQNLQTQYTSTVNPILLEMKNVKCFICQSNVFLKNYIDAVCQKDHIFSCSPISLTPNMNANFLFCQYCDISLELDEKNKYLSDLYGENRVCPLCMSKISTNICM